MSEKTVEDRIVAIEKALKEQKPDYQTMAREERIAGVLQDYDTLMDTKLKAAMEAREKAFDAKLAALNAEKDIQDEEVLRRYLGVAKETTLTTKNIPDLINAFRKAQLEKGDSDKRTPAPEALTKSTGPDGNKTTETLLEKAVREFEASGGTPQ